MEKRKVICSHRLSGTCKITDCEHGRLHEPVNFEGVDFDCTEDIVTCERAVVLRHKCQQVAEWVLPAIAPRNTKKGSPDSIPALKQICPICKGCGNMPASFYTPDMPDFKEQEKPVNCRACKGCGVV